MTASGNMAADNLRRQINPTKEDMLRDALRAAARVDAAGDFFTQYRAARVISERLAWYITDLMPYPAVFAPAPKLLVVCIEKAFAWLEATRAADSRMSGGQELHAYLAGLYAAVPALVEIETTVAGRVWDPLAGKALGDAMSLGEGKGTLEPAFAVADPPPHLADVSALQFRTRILSFHVTGPEIAALRGNLKLVTQEDE